MKRINIIIILVVLLAGLALYLIVFKGSKGSIQNKLKAFAVEDTSSIDKIVMSDKQGRILTLSKKNKIWFVNDSIEARKDLLKNVLDVIKRVEVKTPVNKAMRKNVMKELATSSTQVEIYSDGDLEKKYFVGGSTMDGLGTFMMLDGAEEPFITHIPGFDGYLTLRFNTNAALWKDKIIFKYFPEQISIIEIVYPNRPKESFRLRLEGRDYVGLSNFAGDTAKANINADFLRNYLNNYANIQFENVADPKKIPLEEVMIEENFLASITVYDKEGKPKKVELYKRYFDGLNFLPRSGEYDFDRDRMFMRMGPNTVYNVQYFVFNKLIVTYKDFFSTPIK